MLDRKRHHVAWLAPLVFGLWFLSDVLLRPRVAQYRAVAGAHEECTHAGDHAIRRPEIGRTVPGPIEDQQLVLDEH